MVRLLLIVYVCILYTVADRLFDLSQQEMHIFLHYTCAFVAMPCAVESLFKHFFKLNVTFAVNVQTNMFYQSVRYVIVSSPRRKLPDTQTCHYVILRRSWDWSLSPRECNLKNTCAETAAQSLVVVTLNTEVAT